MTEPVAAYAVPRPAGGHSDFIVYVDEIGDHSLEAIAPEGKTGNKLGMGLKVFP